MRTGTRRAVVFGGNGGSRAPAAPVPVAGSEIIGNRTFADGSWWTVEADWTVGGGVVTHTTPAGGGAFYRDDAITDSWLQLSYDYIGVTTGKITIDGLSFTAAMPAVSGTGALIESEFCGTLPSALRFRASGGFDGAVDNPSVKGLSTASLISTRPYASADCDISVAITRTSRTQAGLVSRVDDPSNPQNFIIAFLDGVGNVRLYKCVAGTWTQNVILSAVTYADGRILRLVCSGNNVSVYYNGTQVGSTTAVADAGIVGNKNHGLFSTYASNSFSDYLAA